MYEPKRPNVHARARLVKSELKRAGNLITSKRFTFKAKKKGDDDIQTDVDVAVEKLFVRFVDECYGEDVGIIGEENIRREPKNGCTLWIIIDPIDGTKAFNRRQTHGVSCLVAEYEDGVITSAYIYNPYTDELIYFREGSTSTWLLFQDSKAQKVKTLRIPKINKFYFGLRSDPRLYSAFIQNITLPVKAGGKIKDTIGYSGSFALMITDLLRGIIHAVVTRPSGQKPWDCAAPWGLMERLGFKAYRVDAEAGKLIELRLDFSTNEIYWDFETIFCRPSFAKELRKEGLVKISSHSASAITPYEVDK